MTEAWPGRFPIPLLCSKDTCRPSVWPQTTGPEDFHSPAGAGHTAAIHTGAWIPTQLHLGAAQGQCSGRGRKHLRSQGSPSGPPTLCPCIEQYQAGQGCTDVTQGVTMSKFPFINTPKPRNHPGRRLDSKHGRWHDSPTTWGPASRVSRGCCPRSVFRTGKKGREPWTPCPVAKEEAVMCPMAWRLGKPPGLLWPSHSGSHQRGHSAARKPATSYKQPAEPSPWQPHSHQEAPRPPADRPRREPGGGPPAPLASGGPSAQPPPLALRGDPWQLPPRP